MLISVAMNYIFLLQLELLNRKASTRDYFGRRIRLVNSEEEILRDKYTAVIQSSVRN